MRDQTNMTAKPLQEILFDKHRTYLSVFAEGEDVEVTIYTGDTAGTSFTIVDGTQWGPQPAPMNRINFSGTGTIILG